MTLPRVLVLYPEEFACRPKFQRKLAAILSRMDAFEVACFADPRGFINDLLDDPRCQKILHLSSYDGITHAVIFDDGEVFTTERTALLKQGIPLRNIQVKITRVINIKREEQYAGLKSTPEYEYIGRGSDWGNPYSMYEFDPDADEESNSREEVIRKYKYDFDRSLLKRTQSEALALAGKRLGCFCKPGPCHGDVIAEFLNAWDDGA